MKIIIGRVFLVCFLFIGIIGLLPIKASAFGIQVHGGGIGVSATDTEGGGGLQYGLDMFIYEGRNLDLFLGAESSNFSERTFEKYSPYNVYYSFKTTAIAYGLRLKMATVGRWKPYLSLGGISGKADYEVTHVDNAVLLLSKSKDSTSFGAAKAGIGMDVGISERLSLGVEANYTYGLPVFKAVVGNQSTGSVEEIKLNRDAQMAGISLGLRYAF